MSEVDLAAPSAPRSLEALRDAVMARKRTLPKRLAQVAAFALANPDDIAFGTVASLAEQALVQPSTLVRFAKTLGFDGFSDLQLVFRDSLRTRVPSYEARLVALRNSTETARAASLLEGFADAAEQSIRSARTRIDPADIERAARTLAQAETIYLIGQRRSFPVTAYLSYAFGKMGIRNVLIGSAVGIDAETVAFATARDAALVVTFRPYASTAVDLAKRVERLGTAMVVITDGPLSPIIPEAGQWFEVVETDYNGFRTLSATMTLAMSLAVFAAEIRASSFRQP